MTRKAKKIETEAPKDKEVKVEKLVFTMTEEQTQVLANVMSIQSKSKNEEQMRQYIRSRVSNIKGATLTEKDGNMYVTKGNADVYPVQVGHTDTVHDIIDEYVLYRRNDVLFAIDGKTFRRTGIGGDDKVGVYIALRMLEELDNIKAFFPCEEEIGLVGTSRCDISFFDDAALILQCDRKGNADFVDEIGGTILYDKPFKAKIKETVIKHGYSFKTGGPTDVKALITKGVEVAVANMSCGYYDPHSANEYVNCTDIENTFQLCKSLHTQFGHEKQIVERPKYVAPVYSKPDYGSWNWDKDPYGTASRGNCGYGYGYGYGRMGYGRDANSPSYASTIWSKSLGMYVTKEKWCSKCQTKTAKFFDFSDDVVGHYCPTCHGFIHPRTLIREQLLKDEWEILESAIEASDEREQDDKIDPVTFKPKQSGHPKKYTLPTITSWVNKHKADFRNLEPKAHAIFKKEVPNLESYNKKALGTLSTVHKKVYADKGHGTLNRGRNILANHCYSMRYPVYLFAILIERLQYEWATQNGYSIVERVGLVRNEGVK